MKILRFFAWLDRVISKNVGFDWQNFNIKWNERHFRNLHRIGYILFPDRTIRSVYGLYIGCRNTDRHIIKIGPYFHGIRPRITVPRNDTVYGAVYHENTTVYGPILRMWRSVFLRPIYGPYRSTWVWKKILTSEIHKWNFEKT
jgi:hypothetical protein